MEVYRNNVPGAEPEPRFGQMGDEVVHAGDMDGDGDSELLARILYDETDDPKLGYRGQFEYRLFEIPARTTPGRIEVDAARTLATFRVAMTDINWGLWRSDPGVIADQDLDGDGAPDYLFLSSGQSADTGGSSSLPTSVGRFDFWSGPPHGKVVFDEEPSVQYPTVSQAFLCCQLDLLESPGTDAPWMVSVPMYPMGSGNLYQIRPAILLASPEHIFDGEPLDRAAAIYTDGTDEMGSFVHVVDLDGDGTDDLVSASYGLRESDVQARRVWMFGGPFDADRSTGDADFIIDGPDDSYRFAYASFVTMDIDGDGYPEIGVVDYETDAAPSTTYFFAPSSSAWPGRVTTAGARSKIVGTESEINAPPHRPRMVGDIDADGVDEAAFPVGHDDGVVTGNALRILEPPGVGVLSLDSTGVLVSGDVDIDIGNTGFGTRALGGVDYDGDSFSDLVVGEPSWDANPDTVSNAFGRFLIFRGEVGAE